MFDIHYLSRIKELEEELASIKQDLDHVESEK